MSSPINRPVIHPPSSTMNRPPNHTFSRPIDGPSIPKRTRYLSLFPNPPSKGPPISADEEFCMTACSETLNTLTCCVPIEGSGRWEREAIDLKPLFENDECDKDQVKAALQKFGKATCLVWNESSGQTYSGFFVKSFRGKRPGLLVITRSQLLCDEPQDLHTRLDTQKITMQYHSQPIYASNAIHPCNYSEDGCRRLCELVYADFQADLAVLEVQDRGSAMSVEDAALDLTVEDILGESLLDLPLKKYATYGYCQQTRLDGNYYLDTKSWGTRWAKSIDRLQLSTDQTTALLRGGRMEFKEIFPHNTKVISPGSRPSFGDNDSERIIRQEKEFDEEPCKLASLKRVVLNCPAMDTMSGGPVVWLNGSQPKVIGILTGKRIRYPDHNRAATFNTRFIECIRDLAN